MKYSKTPPSKSTENIIDFFWDFEGDFSSLDSYNHFTTASVNPKLAFQYETGMKINKDGKSETLFRSGFQCQTKSFYEISAHQKTGIFGISFKPYAIPLLFNIPSSALTDLNIEISDLLGTEGKTLQEKILHCSTTEERIRIATAFIESKLEKATYSHPNVISSIHHILVNKGTINAKQLADDHFLSQRQFERRFKELTGFSPKTFSRIVRFEEFIAEIYRTPQSLTTVSLSSGYYDQSHMIRDFKEFTGKNPKEYFGEDHSVFLT